MVFAERVLRLEKVPVFSKLVIPGHIGIVVSISDADDIPCMVLTLAAAVYPGPENDAVVHAGSKKKPVECCRITLTHSLAVDESRICRPFQSVVLVSQIIVVVFNVIDKIVVDRPGLFSIIHAVQVKRSDYLSGLLIHSRLLLRIIIIRERVCQQHCSLSVLSDRLCGCVAAFILESEVVPFFRITCMPERTLEYFAYYPLRVFSGCIRYEAYARRALPVLHGLPQNCSSLILSPADLSGFVSSKTPRTCADHQQCGEDQRYYSADHSARHIRILPCPRLKQKQESPHAQLRRL